jgi:ABC-type nitrate/sulfonate/bicarbonate transport system ATPase subunit
VTHNVEEAIGLADRLFLLSASPTRVLAEMPIDRPRVAHTPQQLAAIRSEITQKLGPAA